MCLRRAPEKYIMGAALDRAALERAPGTYMEAVWAPQPFVHIVARHYTAWAIESSQFVTCNLDSYDVSKINL
jgi:hypothetical protein